MKGHAVTEPTPAKTHMHIHTKSRKVVLLNEGPRSDRAHSCTHTHTHTHAHIHTKSRKVVLLSEGHAVTEPTPAQTHMHTYTYTHKSRKVVLFNTGHAAT